MYIEMRMKIYEWTPFLTAASPPPGKTQQLNYPKDSNQRAAFQVNPQWTPHPQNCLKQQNTLVCLGNNFSAGTNYVCKQNWWQLPRSNLQPFLRSYINKSLDRSLRKRLEFNMSQELGKLEFIRVVPTILRAGQGREPMSGEAEKVWASDRAVLMSIELELTCVWADWSSDWTGSEEPPAPTEQHSCHLGPRGWTTHVSPAEIFNILHNMLNFGKRKWQGQSKVFKTFRYCQKTIFLKWYYPLLWMSFTKICHLLEDQPNKLWEALIWNENSQLDLKICDLHFGWQNSAVFELAMVWPKKFITIVFSPKIVNCWSFVNGAVEGPEYGKDRI